MPKHLLRLFHPDLFAVFARRTLEIPVKQAVQRADADSGLLDQDGPGRNLPRILFDQGKDFCHRFGKTGTLFPVDRAEKGKQQRIDLPVFLRIENRSDDLVEPRLDLRPGQPADHGLFAKQDRQQMDGIGKLVQQNDFFLPFRDCLQHKFALPPAQKKQVTGMEHDVFSPCRQTEFSPGDQFQRRPIVQGDGITRPMSFVPAAESGANASGQQYLPDRRISDPEILVISCRIRLLADAGIKHGHKKDLLQGFKIHVLFNFSRAEK